MPKQFFIFLGDNIHGPYELLTLIRKIRNGDVHPNTPVATSESSPAQPASSYEELQEIFDELSSEYMSEQEPSTGLQLDFWGAMQHGMEFVKNHVMIMVGSALPILLLFSLAGYIYTREFENYWVILTLWHIFGTVAFFLFDILYFAVLRTNREQHADLEVLLDCLRHHWLQMLLQSFVLAFLLTIPIGLLSGKVTLLFGLMFLFGFIFLLLIATLYIFAPLLVMEKDIPWFTALETSRLTIWRCGIDNLGVLFGLVVLNGVAALFVFPLVFTLPLTLSAICDAYDKIYNT